MIILAAAEITKDGALHLETLLAILTLAGIGLTGFWAWIAKRESTGANKAVNNRNPHEASIYDMVRDTHEIAVKTQSQIFDLRLWRQSYLGGPLDDGQKVNEFVQRVDHIEKTVDIIVVQIGQEFPKLREEIREHGCPIKQGKSDKCLGD